MELDRNQIKQRLRESNIRWEALFALRDGYVTKCNALLVEIQSPQVTNTCLTFLNESEKVTFNNVINSIKADSTALINELQVILNEVGGRSGKILNPNDYNDYTRIGINLTSSNEMFGVLLGPNMAQLSVLTTTAAQRQLGLGGNQGTVNPSTNVPENTFIPARSDAHHIDEGEFVEIV